jgi:hypothetical protein
MEWGGGWRIEDGEGTFVERMAVGMGGKGLLLLR